MKRLSLVISVAFAAAVIAVMLFQEPNPTSTPKKVVANPSAVIAVLREARDNSENLAAMAKSELNRFGKRRELEEGHRLYNEAQVAFNSIIARIANALGSDDPKIRREVSDALEAAEKKYAAFQNWYANTQKRDRRLRIFRQQCEYCSLAPVFEALGITVDLFEIFSGAAAEHRARFDRDLKDCEWKSWDEIKASGR